MKTAITVGVACLIVAFLAGSCQRYEIVNIQETEMPSLVEGVRAEMKARDDGRLLEYRVTRSVLLIDRLTGRTWEFGTDRQWSRVKTRQ